jgi:hypothetical protein
VTDFSRIPVPANPPARIQKKMPGRFQRPRINLGGTTVQRHWRNVLACDLVDGDILPGIGRVHTITETVGGDPTQARWTVTVVGGVDNTRVFDGNELVFAFVAGATP